MLLPNSRAPHSMRGEAPDHDPGSPASIFGHYSIALALSLSKGSAHQKRLRPNDTLS